MKVKLSKSKIIKGALALILACLFCLALACRIIFHILSKDVSTKNIELEFSRKDNMNKVVRLLHNSGNMSGNLKIALLYLHTNHFIFKTKYYRGEYYFPKDTNIISVIKDITNGKIRQRCVTLPEGYASFQVLNILNNTSKLNGTITLAEMPEGRLMPDTYCYNLHSTRRDIVNMAKKSMEKFLAEEWLQRDTSIPIKTPEEALNVASIIEKESYLEHERPLIADVIYNRLKKRIRLQVDPTILYYVNLERSLEGKPVLKKFYRKYLRINTKYNTYKHYGLPPTPITNPSRSAILSALHPANTDNLFFVFVNKKDSFNRDFDNHIKDNLVRLKNNETK